MSLVSLTRFTSPNAGVQVSTAGPDQSTTANLGQAIQNLDTNAFLINGSNTITLGSDGTGDIWYRNSSGIFTRLPIGSTGNVLTVSSGLPAWASPAGKILGSASGSTSNQNITSTASPGTDITSLTVTCTPDGTHDVYIDVWLPEVFNSAGVAMSFAIQKDGSVIQTGTLFIPSSATTGFPTTIRAKDAAPSNASHTYKASAWSSTTQTLTVAGSATATGLITVTQTA